MYIVRHWGREISDLMTFHVISLGNRTCMYHYAN